MTMLVLGILVVIVTATYLAGMCFRGITDGNFPSNSKGGTAVRMTSPVKFWLAEIIVMMAIAVLFSVGCLFIFAITNAR